MHYFIVLALPSCGKRKENEQFTIKIWTFLRKTLPAPLHNGYRVWLVICMIESHCEQEKLNLQFTNRLLRVLRSSIKQTK